MTPFLPITIGCLASGLIGAWCMRRHLLGLVRQIRAEVRELEENMAATRAVDCASAWERGFEARMQVAAEQLGQHGTQPLADADPWVEQMDTIAAAQPLEGYGPAYLN